MAREGSKRQTAIAIMNENSSKPMGEVLPLIAKANGIDLSAARSYYVWLVKNDQAKGKVEARVRAANDDEPKRRGRPRKNATREAAIEKLKESHVARLRKAKAKKATAKKD